LRHLGEVELLQQYYPRATSQEPHQPWLGLASPLRLVSSARRQETNNLQLGIHRLLHRPLLALCLAILVLRPILPPEAVVIAVMVQEVQWHQTALRRGGTIRNNVAAVIVLLRQELSL
jgi:hypothetical protein